MPKFAVWRADHDQREEARVYFAFEPREAVLKHAEWCHAERGAVEWSWPVAFYVADDMADDLPSKPATWTEFEVHREAVPHFWIERTAGKAVPR